MMQNIETVAQSMLFLQIFQKRYSNCVLSYAVRAHQSLGCRGVTRSDFRWNEEKGKEGLYLLELAIHNLK